MAVPQISFSETLRWTWVWSIISCLMTWFHDGLEFCTISIRRESQTDYVQWWFYIWILDLVLQPLCQPSVLLVVDHVGLGVFLRTVLQRHFSSHPLAQARIQWSQTTLCEGTCNKHKGRNWCSCQLSVLSLAPADMKEKHFVRFELSKPVWSSVHWAGNLATGVLYCRHVILPPLGTF